MKRRVRIKPTRTERRQRLARALEETGLKDRGVRLESDAPLKPAPSREWRGRAQTPREKRALSMPRTPGRIDADGPFAQALVDALRAAQTDDVIAESLTHPVHAYPARMHPATARALIELVMHDRDGTLVDPFCGSGTTLVEARAAGVRAFGCDLNPLAVRLARAKTWTAPAPRRRALRDAGRSIAAEALAAGRAA
ncbi:MAG TPA: DNA methyltransferase, partial [Kofleriaceae bacterium]|nr:DNA methyltransferase [Kofleriaceae bacterium]